MGLSAQAGDASGDPQEDEDLSERQMQAQCRDVGQIDQRNDFGVREGEQRGHGHEQEPEREGADSVAEGGGKSAAEGDDCAAVGIDVRTLSRVFQRRYGMGPMQFARARRLDAVNRTLLALDPSEATVTNVATRFGFFHLSRFAGDYRRAFHESPSETLNRGTRLH